MTYEEIIQALKDGGDPRAIAVWSRMKLDFGTYLGNNLTKLKALAKKVKKNHEIAIRLWESDIHDARLLATMIEDPKLVSEKQIDAWMKECRTVDLVDKLCQNVVSATPFADKKMAKWTQSKKEMERRAGFQLLYIKAAKTDRGTDEDLLPYLDQIEKEIRQAPNWAMEAMNLALIGIGSRSEPLRMRALDVAAKIGKITIDYGDTSCQNPDATEKLTSGGKGCGC